MIDSAVYAYVDIPPELRRSGAVRDFGCRFCGAEPGEPCHVRGTGKKVDDPHQERAKAHRESFEAAYRERHRDADEQPARARWVDEDLREHYIWQVKSIMGHLTPEDLPTSTLVSLLAVLIPDHARFLAGNNPTAATAYASDSCGPRPRTLSLVR